MKPRRLDAPLSEEDGDIWLRVARRFSELSADRIVIRQTYLDRTMRQDRYDRDLMYQAQSHPLISGHITESGEHVMLRSNLTSFRRAGLLQ